MNSNALLPHLATVMAGPRVWADDPVSPAIEFQDGVVRNPAVLAFQHRAQGYPHAVIADSPAA